MKLSRYLLERVYLETSTPGSIYAPDKSLICKTLELPYRDNSISNDPALASCIIEGIFLFLRQPPGHGRTYEYFRCVHAPGRHWSPDIKMSSVLIHPANRVDQLLGCISPGSRHLDMNGDGIVDIADSTKKLAWMVKNMPQAFELEIRKKQ